MKFNLKKTLALFTALINVLNVSAKDIPIEDGKVTFTDAQRKILDEEYDASITQEAIDAINKELSENAQVKEAKQQLQEALDSYKTAEQKAADKAKQKNPDGDDEPDLNAQIKQLRENATAKEKAMQTQIKNLNETVAKLLNDPEVDSPLETLFNKNPKEMVHSATHLLGSGKAYHAFEGRNWNKLAAGKTTTATDWTANDGANIQKLNGDAELYFRENDGVVKSLHRDNYGLPTDWDTTFNVVDRIVTGSITTAEITQARKLPWLPKNKSKITPEEGKVYPISIDIEYAGHLLSQIEASWLASMNREGSQYDKMTFVRFLLMELDKRARLEDRIATIKGVYVPTPDNATTPGSFINRQNGLLYWIWKAKEVDKKFRAFDLGALPNATNIADYINNFILSLPYEVRTMQGLELALSPTHLTNYKNRIEQIHGTQNDYTGKPTFPRDYPNIKFQEILDFEGSDFMYITESKNVNPLEYRPAEKSWYRFGFDGKRNIFVINDYKMGIRLKHIGNTVAPGDPAEFKVQSIWTNNAPIFKDDFFIPVFDDETGVINATFNQLKVDEGWKTDITEIKGLSEGVIVRLQGNTGLAAAKNVLTASAKFDLTGNFDLSSGGTLTLRVQADGVLKELKRTTAPETAPEEATIVFDGTSIDSDDGSVFQYTAASNQVLAEIANGVEGDEIKIIGKDGGGNTITVSDADTIDVASNAVLASDADYIELVFVDGKWTEFNRVIA